MPGNRYELKTFSGATEPGADTFTSDNTEIGRFQINGNTSTAYPDNGSPYTVPFSLQGQILYLNNVKWIHCV
jgi:hypothetical protein